jgi:N-acetylglucosaminylphosphatidylinositol deacetylase
MLVSVPLLSKYQSLISPAIAKAHTHLLSMLKTITIQLGLSSPGDYSSSLLFVSSIHGYKTAFIAAQQHQSQLVWFRWLYVTFSRYMWINEWVEGSI